MGGESDGDLFPRLGPRRTGILRSKLGDERQRGARKRLKRWRGVGGQSLHWRSIAKRRVGALGVVVMAPSLDFLAGMTPRTEPMQVQALVPELAVQALDEGVLDWLAWLDEAQPDTGALRPVEHARLVPSGPLSRTISSGRPWSSARSSK